MTILFESTQGMVTPTGRVFLVIGFVLLVIMFFLMLEHDDLSYLITLSFLILTIMCFVIGFICTKPHRRIKAIISDEYTVVELYDKYNVTDREGDIWTLVEKEPMVE